MRTDLHKTAERDFTVGPWRVHRGLHRVSLDGDIHQLEPKVSEVLLHLALHAGQVVSRGELQEQVWGSQHISEDLPRRAIYELRKVLGDDSRKPDYIETIPRAGYRLIAPIAPLDDKPEFKAIESKKIESKRGIPLAWMMAVALLAGSALAFTVLRANRVTTTPVAPLTPLTAWPGLEYDPAYSPDGSRVAFLRTPDSRLDAEISLHVQLPGSESSLRLTQDPADFNHPIQSPAWSPDGTSIAYLRWREEGWWIYQVSALGGAERVVADLRPAGVRGLSWSPDGRWLAFGLRESRQEPYALHRLSLKTLQREKLTHPPATIPGDRSPVYSPDGQRLAFLRDQGPEVHQVHVVSADGGESRGLLPKSQKIADLDWTPDSRQLILALFDAGRHRLWSLNLENGAAERLTPFGENARWLSVARHADRIAYGYSRFEYGIWRYHLETGKSEPMRTLSSTRYDEGLDLDPEGRRVALTSTRSGHHEIWISDVEGGQPVRLTSLTGPMVGHPRWSPDGQRIIFHANPDGHFDLWIVAVDGSAARRVTEHSADDSTPSWSIDGQQLYFGSNRSGEWQIWRMPAAGGEAEQITHGGGYYAQESPDGNSLYFTRWQTHGLWRLSLEDGLEEPVLSDEPRSWDWGNWAPMGDGIYFVTRDTSSQPYLAFYSSRSRAIRRVLTFQDTPVSPSLTFSPDASWLLLTQLDQIESDVILVDSPP